MSRWVLVAAFVLALVPFSINVARRVETFGRADLLVSEEGSAYRVRAIGESAGGTGLVVDDVILLVDGKDARTSGDPSILLASRSAELTVYRGGELVRFQSQPAPAPWSARYLFLLFAGGVFFVSGLSALRVRGDSAEGLLFAAFALTVSLVLVLTPAPPYDGFHRFSTLLEDTARALFPALLLQLVFTFPRRARHTSATSVFYLPAFLLLGATLRLYLLPSPGSWAVAGVERLDGLQAVWMCTAAVLAAGRLLVLSRRTIDLLTEKQIRFLLFGTAVGLLPLCLLNLLPRLLGGSIPVLSSLALLPLALLPVAFLAALTRYRLWDVEAIGRETAALVGAVLAGAGFFTLAHLFIAHPRIANVPWGPEGLQTAAGLLVALSFVPMRRGLSGALKRLQYRDSWHERESLLQLVKDLGQPRRLHEIETLLTTRIARGLSASPVSLLLVHADGRLDAVTLDGGDPIDIDELPPEVRSRASRLSRGSFASRPTGGVARLRRAGFRTLAPLAVSGRLLAICAVGDRTGGVPLSTEDRELLDTVLAPGALALDHARLYAELEEQAERYRTLKEFHEDVVAGSAAAIAATGPDGRFTSANEALGRLVGRSPGELLGQRADEILPKPLCEPNVPPRIEVNLGSGPRFLDVAMSPFPGSEPGSMARVFVIHDATETVRLERALSDRERLAALGSLSAGVAHEVNTPLTGVTGFARLLLDEIPPEDPRRGLVEKIERQAFRAARLVGSLLDLARGRPRDMTRLDPCALAREARRSLEDELAGRRTRLTLELPEQAPAVVGHADALVQVLVNLLKNGVEAVTPQPAGEVTLRLRAEAGRILFDVVDNGPGLTPEQTSHAFEPFYSTKTAQGGTGLGLAIAGDIIRAHGGTLGVESAPGGGARFTVTLPVATT